MRIIILSEGPTYEPSVSRPLLLKDPQIEGSSIWVPELEREITISRVYPGEAIYLLGTAGDVEVLLGASGTPWVDHRAYMNEEARKVA